jgi:predicted restriction endonuclease
LLGRSILDIAGVNPALIKSSKAQSTLTGDDSTAMTETERETITKIRTKQGPFRTKLIDKYKGCCVLTGLSNQDLLIASHIKPWSKSTGRERLDSNNGLLLATPIDTLFDKFLISFNDNGTIVISKGLSDEARQVFGINSSMRLRVQLNQETKEYLNTHRKNLK